MGHYTLAAAPSAKIFIFPVSVQNLCVKRFSLAVVVAVAALSPVFAKSQAPAAGTSKKALDVIYVPTPPEMVSEMLRVPQQVALPPPFPRANATKLLDTDRITVWDIVWPKGQPTAMHRHVYDQVGTYYASGGRLITTPDGTARAIVTEVGSLSTTRKGTTHIEEGNTDPPLRAVFIELKRETPSGLPDADVGGPAAFPRAGAKQVLDDDRVTVWDYTWVSGSQGLRYRPARETVVVWLGAGKVRVTPSGGAATERDVNAGAMHHLTAGSNETVEVVSGSPRAILFQLK